MEETIWRKSDVKEGFDLFGDDYFINVKRKIGIKPKFGKFIDKLKKLLKKIPNPIKALDEAFVAFLKSILMLMIGQIDCKTGNLNTVLADTETGGFTWASGKMDLLNNGVQGALNTTSNGIRGAWDKTSNGAQGAWEKSSNGTRGLWDIISNGARDLGDTIGNEAQDTYNSSKEQFSMPDNPDLIDTIKSFLENHPKLDKIAVTTYYLKKLNAYELSIGAPPTSNQMFIFNNEFDNILEDPSIVSELETMAKNTPDPSYPNTEKGFADFLENSARFSFSNDTPITYYAFATQYFPYPTDLKGFEEAIHNPDDPNYVQNINQYLSSLSKPADPPPNPMTPTSIDTNYAFSSNLETSYTDSIQNYLKYIAEWYALILYNKYNSDITILFPTIEANVCMEYTEYLNAIEFQKYRIYSTYLTPYELALFNHLFFISLQQDEYTNVYNKIIPPDGNPQEIFSSGTPIVYINLMPQPIVSLVSVFTMEINNRVKYLSGSITTDNYQPLPLDGVLVLPQVPQEAIPSINILLPNYVLGLFTGNIYGDTSIPDVIKPSDDIQNYYLPLGLSACEQENNRMQEECEEYAKKIKQEIYRMISIPIMIYIVYNVYYIFFFKDCFDMAKTTDETGKNTYKRYAEECFAPIFPDWEMMFRTFEQRQTDFLFEFVFKPVKIMYTLLNAIKGWFRGSGWVLKDEFPYIFFLFTFSGVYTFIQARGNIILKTLGNLLKFKLPDIQIMGQNTLDSYAKGVTYVFFFFSFLNKFFGFSISKMALDVYKAFKDREAAKAAAAAAAGASGAGPPVSGGAGTPAAAAQIAALAGGPPVAGATDKKTKTWAEWIMNPGDGAFTKLVKIICAIIFWIIKFVVTKKMINLSKFILNIYFFVIAINGIGTYANDVQTGSYKIDLIHRIFYTKLCSSKYKTAPFKYFIKCLIFLPIYFLVEMVILHNLTKGTYNYSTMESNKKAYNTGLSEKTNEDTDKNSMAVKTFMMVLNGLIMIIVLLWCVYKGLYKMPDFVRSFEEQENPSTDKRFMYDCTKPDAYEKETENRIIKTMMKSDEFNKIFMKQLEDKTAGMIKPSMFSGLVKTMNDYKERVENTLGDAITKAGELKNKASETVFGKKK
jgi:hypothetical protein